MIGVRRLMWCACMATAACQFVVPDFGGGGGGGGGGAFTSDNDRISTAVEMNGANAYLNLDTLINDPDPSRAEGMPTFGRIFKAINLPDSQAGYRHHYGVLADRPDKDDWGVLALINRIEGVAAWWRDPYRPCITPAINPNPPQLFQVGDLSKGLASGAPYFGGAWSDHAAHQNGLDVDLRFIRTDHDTLPLHLDGPSAIYYDRGATEDLMWCFLYQSDVVLLIVDTIYAKVPFYGDPRIEHKADHRDHFHIRVRDPDGTNN